MDGDGSGCGDVSLTATGEVHLADPEVPQPNAWPPMGPTENDVAFLRQFTRAYYGGRLVLSTLPLLSGPNTGRTSPIFFFDTRDDGGGGEGDPRHGDVDADDAGEEEEEEEDDDDEDDDDAYGGFGFSFGAVPASGVAIACLPETTVGELVEGEVRESGQCAVCLEEYEAGDALRTMPCAHGFHERCIFGWLRASRLCPLCRFALPAEEENTATDVDVGRDEEGESDEDDGSDDGGALEYQ